MKFANPTAWQWAWVAVPIVACYLAKVRATRVAISTILFWQRAAERSPTRWHARLPRRWLSLAAQLVIVACFTLALVQPFLSGDQRTPRRWVLIVDTSASMGATDEQPTRLQAAIQLGRRCIASVQPGDSVAIIAAGARARIVQPPTDDREALRLALDELASADTPTGGSNSMTAAVALARQIVAGRPGDGIPGQIVLLSDGCFGEARHWADAADIELVRVGTAAGNLAITACGARRNADNPAACRLLIEVTNFSAKPAETGVAIDVGERTIELAPLRLEPDAVWQKTIALSGADLGMAGATASVRLTATDVLMADNRASIDLPTCPARTVVLVTNGNRLLQAALEAQPGLNLAVVARLPSDARNTIPADAILVFDGVTPPRLPTGRLLVIGPVNSCDCWSIGGKLEHTVVGWQDRHSPLLSGVRLEQLRLDGIRRLTFSSPARVLASTETGDALYTALERPQGRALVLTTSTDEGDLTHRTAFPILINNALAWLGADPVSKIRRRVETASGLLDRRESDLRLGAARLPQRRSGSVSASLVAADKSRLPRPISALLLGGGLGCVVVEWWLYQRRGVR